MSTATSTASQVREFHRAAGVDAKWTGEAARGVIPKDAIASYNEAHPEAPYTPGSNAPTVPVTFTHKDKRGRNQTSTEFLTVSDIRELVGETGKKGPMSAQTVLRAASVLSERRSQA